MKLVLVGYMGSGKSAMGRLSAAAMGVRHIDLDDYIEIRHKESIPSIFARCGESAFRTMESESLHELMEREDDFVLSLGGGTPCFMGNMDYLQGRCYSVYLQADASVLSARLAKSSNPRPLLAGKSGKELEDFVREGIAKRESYYMMCDAVLNVNTSSIQQSVDALLALIKEKNVNINNKVK